MLHRALLLALASIAALAQAPPGAGPVIGEPGIRHGATFEILAAPPFSGAPQGVAPGAIFLVQGERLGPADLVAGQAPFGLRLPDEPGGTEVHVRSIGSGKVAQAAIVYAVSYQVAAILPRGFPLGDAEVTVWSGGQVSEPVTVPVVFSFPGLFTVSRDGHGRAIVQNVEADGELTLNSLVHSARPGQYVTLWTTGLGNARAEDVRVYFGDDFYPAAFAGPAPGLEGVDQINVRIPEDVPVRGCYVRLVVAGDGLGSGPASIAIADEGGACDHPWGLSAERLAEIEAGDPARLLTLSLWKHDSATDDSGASGAGGYAYAFDVAQLEIQSRDSAIPLESPCVWRQRVLYTREAFPDLPPDLPPIMPPPILDIPSEETPAGYPWTLTGPGGRLLMLGSQATARSLGAVGAEPQEAGFMSRGDWTVHIPGGAEVGPLSFDVEMPAIPEVSVPSTIRRGEDFELAWSNEEASPEEAITVRLEFRQPRPAEAGVFDDAYFACSAETGAAGISIPLSRVGDPLDRTLEGNLTITVSRPQLPAHSQAVDRVEASTVVSRSWTPPLE